MRVGSLVKTKPNTVDITKQLRNLSGIYGHIIVLGERPRDDRKLYATVQFSDFAAVIALEYLEEKDSA